MKQNLKIGILLLVVLSSLLMCGMASVYSMASIDNTALVNSLAFVYGVISIYGLGLYTVWHFTVRHHSAVWHP